MLIEDIDSILMFKTLFNRNDVSISQPLEALHHYFFPFSFMCLDDMELRRMTTLNNNRYRPCLVIIIYLLIPVLRRLMKDILRSSSSFSNT
jgi:hypothetical protein